MKRYFDEVLRDKPSLYLRFEESAGTLAADVSGNGLDGTYHDTPTLGVVGALSGYEDNSAIRLNGTTEYVSVADNSLLDPGNTFTLEFWLKLGSIGSIQYILDKGTNGYAVVLDSAGVISLAKSNVAGIIPSTTVLVAGSWYHVVFTKSGPTSKCYINGVDVTGSNAGDQTIAATASALEIGRQNGFASHLDGSIDEVAIYPNALSSTRVEAHYKSAIPERNISMNEAPYELISAPGTIFRAPVGTQFPDPDDTPGMSWLEIGSSGNLNLTDAGITISQPQTLSKFRPLGSGAPAKAFRSEEDLMIKAVLADLTLEQYNELLNKNTVETVDGFATVGLHRGISVAQCALLVRFDVSPYREDGTSQFEIPVAVQQGQPELVFNRGGSPVGLALEWCALVDPSATSDAERLGRFRAKLADT